jgi:site-specific DNA-methyltransferase (adenine-specific)
MINKVVIGPARVRLNELEDNIIDLTVTSPPYNVSLGDNKYNDFGYDTYSDDLPHDKYISWLKEVFATVYSKTKSGGRCVVNIGDGKNGSIPTHAHIINFMEDIGWNTFTTIIWDKKNVSNRCAWGSWLSPSSPSFPKPFEYILIFYKDIKKLQWKGETDLEKQEFIDWAYGLWEFPGTKTWHPAPFPEELPMRCIKMLSWKNSLIADPFAGSGTTLKVAKKLGRNYWGCDISEDYVLRTREELSQI